MEFNFIKIEDSFNKNDHQIEKGAIFPDLSTKGQSIQNIVTVNSQTEASSTSNKIQNDNFIKNILPKSSFTRDIFVGASGAVIATIISYFIFGIK